MPEYVITPDKTNLPPGPRLMDKLHHRGFPVEINVKGSAENWIEIRFYEPGPPELECTVLSDEKNGRLKVFVSNDAPPRAKELQIFLVDLLLKELGGQADNSATRERYSAEEFSAKLKNLYGSTRKAKDLFWIGFSWAVVFAGIIIYFFSPQLHGVVAVIVVLSSLSAVGLTYSHFKP